MLKSHVTFQSNKMIIVGRFEQDRFTQLISVQEWIYPLIYQKKNSRYVRIWKTLDAFNNLVLARVGCAAGYEAQISLSSIPVFTTKSNYQERVDAVVKAEVPNFQILKLLKMDLVANQKKKLAIVWIFVVKKMTLFEKHFGIQLFRVYNGIFEVNLCNSYVE